MKSVLRIVYILIALIAVVLVYIMGYNSNSINHIINMTNEALESKDYVQLAKIHGGCLDVNNISKENSDDLDLAIFPATTLSSYSYYKDDKNKETVQTNSYDKAYYIYIAYPKFTLTSNELNGEYVNDAAIKFVSNEGSYTYKFEITETVNSKLYNKTPYSVNDIILKGQRQSLTYYENWGFINVTLSESVVNAISSDLKGDINKIEILDRDGKSVYSESINLDFKQDFFKDVQPLCDNYNTYINEVNSDDKAVKEAAEEKFNKFYEGTESSKGFEETFLENTNYTFRLADSKLQPGSLVWQTIGIEVLFVIVLVLLYFLLFHFQLIKRLISRENKGKGYRVNPTANKRTVIDAKAKPVKEEKPAPIKEEIKSTPIKEENKEQAQEEASTDTNKVEEN